MKVYIAVGVGKFDQENLEVGLSRETVVLSLDRLNRTIHHVVGIANVGTGEVAKVDTWVANMHKSMVADETATSHIGVDRHGFYRMLAPDGSVVDDYMGNIDVGWYKYVKIEEWEAADAPALDLPKVGEGDYVRSHYDVWE